MFESRPPCDKQASLPGGLAYPVFGASTVFGIQVHGANTSKPLSALSGRVSSPLTTSRRSVQTANVRPGTADMKM